MSKIKTQIKLGKKYTEWTVIYSQDRQVFCKCSCGTQKFVCKYALIKGRSTNCGCKNRLKPIFIGTVFGNLTVLPSIEKRGKRGELLVLVKCSCNQEKYVNQSSLKKGLTKSCGCLRNEIVRKRKVTHGLCNSYEYKIWLYIKSICYNQNHSQYKYYGSYGVEVSSDWCNNFIQFLKDMGTAPTDTNISRLDPSGNFCATNCFWLPKTVIKAQNYKKNYKSLSPLVTNNKTEKLSESNYVTSEVNTAIVMEHAAGEPNMNTLAFKYQLSKMEIVNIILQNSKAL